MYPHGVLRQTVVHNHCLPKQSQVWYLLCDWGPIMLVDPAHNTEAKRMFCAVSSKCPCTNSIACLTPNADCKPATLSIVQQSSKTFVSCLNTDMQACCDTMLTLFGALTQLQLQNTFTAQIVPQLSCLPVSVTGGSWSLCDHLHTLETIRLTPLLAYWRPSHTKPGGLTTVRHQVTHVAGPFS